MENTLKKKIKHREKLIGSYLQLADVSIARIMGLVGFDFIWIDCEHSHMSYETLLSHILALRSTGTPIIVRAPQHDLTATKKIVEMGVDGIIFPMIHTKEEADEAISNTLYPPYGTRGFGPMGAIDYGLQSVPDYIANTRDELCRFVQIEHKDAIENLDAIMENPYIDGYIFGPNDLSGSYDRLGDVFCNEITSVIADAVKRLHAHGKYVGIASGGIADEVLTHWSSFGVEMLCAGADFDYLREGARKSREKLTRIHKKSLDA